MAREFPTTRYLIYELLSHIKNHPLIKNPVVYTPSVEKEEQTLVHVDRYRSYDGHEYTEPGLTVSVFPAYSSHTFSSGFRSNLFNSVKFTQSTLGSTQAYDSYQDCTYNIAVALQYQATAINETIKVRYTPVTNKNPIEIDSVQALLSEYDNSINSEMFEVEINYAEDILRDYLDVLRFVLIDFTPRNTLSVKSLEIESYDFPTTSWDKESEQIYFHYAYLMVKVKLIAPNSYSPLKPMPLKTINIS